MLLQYVEYVWRALLAKAFTEHVLRTWGWEKDLRSCHAGAVHTARRDCIERGRVALEESDQPEQRGGQSQHPERRREEQSFMYAQKGNKTSTHQRLQKCPYIITLYSPRRRNSKGVGSRR